MQFSNLPILCIALLSTLALATPIIPSLEPRATPCSKAQTDLSNGIKKNIDIQKQELAALDTVSKNPTGSQFNSAKSKLVSVVKQGVTVSPLHSLYIISSPTAQIQEISRKTNHQQVRQNNQKIAPKNSPALAGLSKVANAQKAELSLAQGLNGDAKKDKADIATLKSDFQGGIKQNQQNMKDALNGCTTK